MAKFLLVLLIGTCLMMSGCGSDPPLVYTPIDIDLEDGINADEAMALAEAYFLYSGHGCGAVGEVIDEEEQWRAETVIGVAAQPYHPIYIEKKTGIIHSKMGRKMKATDLIKIIQKSEIGN